jgi:Fe-S-cluster-containing dehydrogenase component
VRSRGVMEKCTYCVQRIRHAQIDADREERRIVDGEVVTACQAACPAGAIAFGDLNDPNGSAAQWRGSPLNYGLLEDLGTRPRTTYLAAVRNPNPELEKV